MLHEGDAVAARRLPHVADPSRRLVADVSDGAFDAIAAGNAADDHQVPAVARPLRFLHVLGDGARRAATERPPRQRAGGGPSAEVVAAARAADLGCKRVEQLGDAGRARRANVARVERVFGRNVAHDGSACALASDDDLLFIGGIVGRLSCRGRGRGRGGRPLGHGLRVGCRRKAQQGGAAQQQTTAIHIIFRSCNEVNVG